MFFMTEIQMLLTGWFVGLLIAMPVGMVAVMCIKRTLHSGWVSGVATGLGAALADTIYAAFAAFGIYAVQDFLTEHQYTMRLVGGGVMLFVGVKLLWQKANVDMDAVEEEDDPDAWHRILHAFVTGLVLTLTNPLTLIAFITIFANFGLTDDMASWRVALVFVAGALLGASTWWLSLVGGVTLIKEKLPATMIAKINTVLAVFLVLAGVYAVVTGWLEKPLLKILH